MKRLKRINYIYNTLLNSTKVSKNKILLESFHGKAFVGDPYAILLKYLEMPEYKHCKFVVVINEKKNITNKKIRRNQRVRFVKVGTKQYLYDLVTSKYLINNVSFPPYFIKRKEQIYLNTWHGTPYKTLGKDMKNAKGTEANLVANFLKADFTIHASDYTREIVESAHCLDNWKGTSLLSAPRFDLYKQNKHIEEYLIKEFDIAFDKEIILYCPTWTGSLKNINNNHSKIIKIFKKLQMENPDKVVLLKVHSLVFSRMSEEEREFVIDDKFEIVELMYYVDTVISDYSSAVFDFMYSGKRIIHYMPDYTEYKYDRGLYLEEDELPGLVAKTYKQLNAILTQNITSNYSDKYNRFINVEATTDELIKNLMSFECIESSNEKQNVLIYAGGFANNGVTTSLLNFTKNFNYDDYNLYIVEKDNSNEISELNLAKLDPRAHILYRRGRLVAGLTESVRYLRFLKSGIISSSDEKSFKKLFEREHKRIFGDLEFDIYIDFSGYVNYWSAFMAFSNDKTKYIYQHNDMYSEFYKVVNNKRVHIDKLTCVFALYKYYDKVIAVSDEVRELNLLNLNEFYTEDQSIWMGNYLDADSMYQQVLSIDDEQINLLKRIKAKYNPSMIMKKQQANDKLLREFGLFTSNTNDVSDSQPIYCGYFGRFSPEKGQLRFINELNEILKYIPNLVVIFAGDGPDLNEVKKRVKFYGIEANVIFTGHLTNPYPLMELVDFVILLSSSEGQPMVILEALCLGKKVIASDIEGNRSLLKNGYGMLIEPVASEFIDAVENFERYSMFDATNYNEALNDKYRYLFSGKVEEYNENEKAQ